MADAHATERVNTIVIGGGQAGLSVGYHLAMHGVSFVILDASARVGDVWRHRWDSLRLFTPAKLAGLDGMSFPAPPNSFPTKDEMADFLEAYARRVRSPCALGRAREPSFTPRRSIHRRFRRRAVRSRKRGRGNGELSAAECSDLLLRARCRYRATAFLRVLQSVPVASGRCTGGRRGQFGRRDRGRSRARSPNMVSGARYGPFAVPDRRHRSASAVHAPRPSRLVPRVLTIATPIGRRVRPKVLHGAAPLIRLKPRDLTAAGVQRVPRVTGVRNGLPILEDDRVLDVRNVIWCTGYHAGFSWIDLPVFGPDGDPRHEAGIVASELACTLSAFTFSMRSRRK